MKRAAELEKRLRTLDALAEAVRALKNLSAHHFRELREAVEPARIYRAGIERLLASAELEVRGGTGGAGLLVVGAELGLCGSYNARVVEFAVAQRAALGPGPTLCVGRRAASKLRRFAIELGPTYGAPTSIASITQVLLTLAGDILDRFASDNLGSFAIVASRFAGVGTTEPVLTRLLPVTPRPDCSGPRPQYVTPAQFASVALREYLYITLFDLLLDASATEHGARLLATQSAEAWLDEQTERLRRQRTASQRESTTQDMLETAVGVRARRG